MGRPLKKTEPDAAKVTIGLRISGELRRRLEQRAAANDRTLSGEAARILERSFDPEALALDSFDMMNAKRRPRPRAALQRVLAAE
jgi:hypothetical protein